MGIHRFHILGIVWISASLKIVEKPINLKCLCFFMLFLYNGNPLFPYFGNCMDFCIKRNISEKLNFEMFVFSHIFSPKIFEKLRNVCFFPILLPYYGNPHFSCVWNCMDICFQQKIPETLNFEMFMFSHIFSLLCEFIFLIFWKIYGLMPNMKYVRNP